MYVGNVVGDKRIYDVVEEARLGRAFGIACGETDYDATVDFSRDCLVDGDDLTVLATNFAVPFAPVGN